MASFSQEGATALSKTTFIITTLSIKGLFEKFSLIDIQHKNIQHNNTLPLYSISLCWVSLFIYCYAECHYAVCRYDDWRNAECRGAHPSNQKFPVNPGNSYCRGILSMVDFIVKM